MFYAGKENLLETDVEVEISEPYSQETLNNYYDSMLETLREHPLQVYAKTGKLPESLITVLFDYAQTQSLNSEHSLLFSHPVKFFTFHIDKSIFDLILNGEKFYKFFINRFAEFLNQIPEYKNDYKVQELLGKMNSNDFSQVYGEYDLWRMDEKRQPLFRNDWNFMANFSQRILNKYFHSKDRDREFPILVPIINFQFPEVPYETETHEILEILRKFHETVPYFTENRDEKEEALAKITNEEKGIVEIQRIPVSWVLNHINNAKNIPNIVAAPLQALEVIPYDEHGCSWLGALLANDVLLDEFRYLDMAGGMRRI